jgi:hypothetical protein
MKFLWTRWAAVPVSSGRPERLFWAPGTDSNSSVSPYPMPAGVSNSVLESGFSSMWRNAIASGLSAAARRGRIPDAARVSGATGEARDSAKGLASLSK